MSNNITALREHLFDAIASIKAGTLDLDKARAINEIGKTLIDSAKVEVDYIRATDATGDSTFLAPEGQDKLPPGITGVTQHRLARR